jgi:glycosyltransferase involved in cell wall biosynthesis
MAARIIVEGWRGAPIGFASVYHGVVLEMLRRPDLEVYARDLSFWSPSLAPSRAMLPAADQARLDALQPPPRGVPAEAVLRIASPIDATPSVVARRAFVWAAPEVGIVEPARIGHGLSTAQAFGHPGVDFITSSNSGREAMLRSGASAGKVTVIPGGFDPEVFTPANDAQREELRRAMGWEGKFVFLHVSSLAWTKGVRLLLTAFAYVAQRFPHAVLAVKANNEWFGSDRMLQENLAAMPPEMASVVAPRIAYLGETFAADRLAQVYNAADVCVQPYHAEAFGFPVLEAAACGLPVIVPSGGPTDEFTDPRFALHIRSRPVSNPDLVRTYGDGAQVLNVDGDHLVEQMSVAINDPAIARRAREQGPALLRERFTWKHVTDRVLELILPPVHPGWLQPATPARSPYYGGR